MGFIWGKAKENQKPKPVDVTGIKWGFHVHMDAFAEGDFTRIPGEFVVIAWWDYGWRDLSVRKKCLAIVQRLAAMGKKIIVRIEDHSVFLEDFGGPKRCVDPTWWNEVYQPLLLEMVPAIKDSVWAFQIYNEPFLSMRGGNGGNITPEEVFWLQKNAWTLVKKLAPECFVLQSATENYHDKKYRAQWDALLKMNILAYTDLFNVHVYTDSPSQVEHYYEALGKMIGAKFPVIVTEVNGSSGRSPEQKWESIEQIVSFMKRYFNLKGACPYSWWEPDYSAKPKWTCRGTIIEDRIRELSAK